MTQEDIIKLAREAGFTNPKKFTTTDANLQGILSDFWENLERFYQLAVAAERERIIAANAPEIERVNTYIKELEEAMPPKILRAIRARGQA